MSSFPPPPSADTWRTDQAAAIAKAGLSFVALEAPPDVPACHIGTTPEEWAAAHRTVTGHEAKITEWGAVCACNALWSRDPKNGGSARQATPLDLRASRLLALAEQAATCGSPSAHTLAALLEIVAGLAYVAAPCAACADRLRRVAEHEPTARGIDLLLAAAEALADPRGPADVCAARHLRARQIGVEPGAVECPNCGKGACEHG